MSWQPCENDQGLGVLKEKDISDLTFQSSNNLFKPFKANRIHLCNTPMRNKKEGKALTLFMRSSFPSSSSSQPFHLIHYLSFSSTISHIQRRGHFFLIWYISHWIHFISMVSQHTTIVRALELCLVLWSRNHYPQTSGLMLGFRQTGYFVLWCRSIPYIHMCFHSNIA